MNLEEFDQHLLRSDFPNLTEVKQRALEGRLDLSVGELWLFWKKKFQTTRALILTVLLLILEFFFNDVGIFSFTIFKLCIRKWRTSITQRLGIIILLPKGDKPKQFLKKLRPITLLNFTYKLASACIIERIKNILPDLINDDQKGFMKGRYIGENIRLLYELIFYTKLRKNLVCYCL